MSLRAGWGRGDNGAYGGQAAVAQKVKVTCIEWPAAGVAMSAALILGQADLEDTLQSASRPRGTGADPSVAALAVWCSAQQKLPS